MKKSPLPFKKMIFVCTNARAAGERVSCAGGGRCGIEILDKLKAAVKEAGLSKTVRVTRTGCLDRCEDGPNLLIIPDGDHLSGVTLSDVDSILPKHVF